MFGLIRPREAHSPHAEERIGRAERATKLVFAPAVNLNVLDPVVTGIRSTRNHAYLVFDTLYGVDTSWTA